MKFIIKIVEDVKSYNIAAFSDKGIAEQFITDLILAHYDLTFITRINNDECNFHCFKINEYIISNDTTGLIDYVNNLDIKYRKNNIKFVLESIKYINYPLLYKSQLINNVSAVRALIYKQQLNNASTANNVPLANNVLGSIPFNIIVNNGIGTVPISNGNTTSNINASTSVSNNTTASNSNNNNNNLCNGATCRKCKSYNEYAVPDSSDGTMLCSGCKIWIDKI